MNEKRFISLVNLYIDHEISPEELEELENEVAHNDQRRRIYHEYRRLQLASQTACQEFGSLVETVDLKKYHILARCSHHSSRTGFFYSIGAVMAACLSVLAAVSVFPSKPAEGDQTFVEKSSMTVVEVFKPTAADARLARGSTRTTPILTAGTGTTAQLRSRETASNRVPKGAEFLGTQPSANRPAFHFSTYTGNPLGDDFRSGSTGRVFRSGSAFEGSDLVSVQFQR